MPIAKDENQADQNNELYEREMWGAEDLGKERQTIQ
jgi:hypothetical protein